MLKHEEQLRALMNKLAEPNRMDISEDNVPERFAMLYRMLLTGFAFRFFFPLVFSYALVGFLVLIKRVFRRG